jgi:tetratricopeptide (TPR) repeat protein
MIARYLPPETSRALLLRAIALFLITFVAYIYIPWSRAGFIWDDDAYIENNQTLRTTGGLRQIWFEPGATPQYYPLVFTSFWVEYHLWGLEPGGYHLVNILLHAANACLLWLILRRLAVPGAWLAAAILALHPVEVESVAWITERKNVLSGFFYFCALLAYLRFCLPVETGMPVAEGKSKRRNAARTQTSAASDAAASAGWVWYGLAFALFVCALLSKTVTCSLPAAVLLLLWWKRGTLRVRSLTATLPFFVVGILMSFVTIWMEKHVVGAEGDDWHLWPIERCLLAGRALWFYAAKLAWPVRLTFIYPRWEMDWRVWWQYLFPAAALAVIVALWLFRPRLGRGPLVAVLLFSGTLVPALGFIDIYPMRFSFVADHFQYLASAALIALAAATAVTLFDRHGGPQIWKGIAVAGAYLLCLGVLTWQQTEIYRDRETLWTDTLEKNPGCRMAHNNLGTTLARDGRVDEAIRHFNEAIKLNPDDPRAHFNLGQLLEGTGKFDDAEHHFREALRVNPEAARVHNELGRVLLQQRKLVEAVDEFTAAVQLNSQYEEASANLIEALIELGNAFKSKGKPDLARQYYRKAVRVLQDRDPNWRLAALQSAWALATGPDAKERNGLLALELAVEANEGAASPRPEALDILAAAYAENGQFTEAVRAAREALTLIGAQSRPGLANQIQERLRLYQEQKPFRRTPN